MSKDQTMKETGRTPSMFASLLVLGVMVALILLSVGFFGGEVAEGPLQVSMTLATLFALSVSYYYGFRGSLINHTISKSLSGVMGTIFVILAIGTVIGTLYLTGTVANIIYYGVAIISARFYYITIFIIALALSMMLGSSLTTVGAVGVAVWMTSCGKPFAALPAEPSPPPAATQTASPPPASTLPADPAELSQSIQAQLRAKGVGLDHPGWKLWFPPWPTSRLRAPLCPRQSQTRLVFISRHGTVNYLTIEKAMNSCRTVKDEKTN